MFATADPEAEAARDATFPEGWFALALAEELGPTAVIPRRAFGRDLVLWRTSDGAAHAANAECPHYSVHMGRGGTVKEDGLACPIHGLRFDRLGQCMPARPGRPAPSLSIRTYPVHEAGGVIFVWRDLAQAPPAAPPEVAAGATLGRWRLDGDWAAAVEVCAAAMPAVRLYATPIEADLGEIIAVAAEEAALADLKAALGPPWGGDPAAASSGR